MYLKRFNKPFYFIYIYTYKYNKYHFLDVIRLIEVIYNDSSYLNYIMNNNDNSN